METEEELRLERMSVFERDLAMRGFSCVAGVDEAGRGPLAGPVVAAACVLYPGFFLFGLNDSKQLTAEKRSELYLSLVNDPLIFYGLGVVDVEEIDRLNILQASLLAMQKALLTLPKRPDYMLVDGNVLPKVDFPGKAIVEGDAKSLSIAAASVFAKVTRDRLMDELDEKYPLYGFKKHKGYATLEHRKAIEEFGPCPIHRKSFEPIKTLLEPSFFSFWKD